MKKEEILEASRKENKQKDFYEIEVENKAVKIAAITMIILTTIYYCLEIFIKGETNHGWYSLIALYCFVLYGYKALKIKSKFYTFCSIIWFLVTVICVYLTIKNIIVTSTIL